MTPWTCSTPGLPCHSLSPGICSHSCSLSPWCHPTISSFVAPFSSCPPQSFPASGSFPVSWLFTSGGQSNGPSASASVLPMTIQNWFPLGWTGWIFLQSKGLTFPAPQLKSINPSVLSLLYGPTLTCVHDYWQKHHFDYMGLCLKSDISVFNMLTRFIIAFLPRSKCLLISWL